MFKKIIVASLLMFTFLLIGCDPSTNTSSENQEPNSIESSNENTIVEKIDTKDEPEQTVEDLIIELLNTQQDSILNKDKEKFINTINEDNKDYYSERSNWYHNLVDNNCDNLYIKLEEILSLEENRAIAKVHIVFDIKDNHYDMSYPEVFIRKGNEWIDNGLNFKEIDNKNFKIFYLEGNEHNANLLHEAAIENYKIVTERFGQKPKDIIIFRLYDNTKQLRQFTMPSFAWEYDGWTSGSGVISFTVFDKLKLDDEIKKRFAGGVRHEIVHKITLDISGDSLQQWFFEGLAKYYEDGDLSSDKEYSKDYKLWNIDELIKGNLGNLTDKNIIRGYYYSGQGIVSLLAQEYGDEKLVEFMQLMGSDSLNNEDPLLRFKEGFEKGFGISFEDFEIKWNNYIKSMNS